MLGGIVSGFSHHSDAELVDRLPPPARARLVGVTAEIGAAHAVLNDLQMRRLDTWNEIQRRRQVLDAHRRSYERGERLLPPPGPGEDISRREVETPDEAIARHERILADLDAEIAIAQERKRLAPLRSAILTWLRDTPFDLAIVDLPRPEPELRAGESFSAAVERVRSRRRELLADLRRVDAAPWPSSLAKSTARALVDQLAEHGAPNVFRAIERGGEIQMPSQRVRLDVRMGGDLGLASGELPDATALLAWMFPAEMVAALEREIDASADDGAAMTKEQRAAAKAEIESDLRFAEIAECSLIEAARAREGIVIDVRPDVTPEAFLSVAAVPVADAATA